MKFTDTKIFKSRIGMMGMGATLLVVSLLVGSGCNKAPMDSAAAVAQQQKSANDDIQAIQNNPNMPAEAKEHTIAAMKAQQARTATKP